jgi:uncharacterized protein (DUF1778 family)
VALFAALEKKTRRDNRFILVVALAKADDVLAEGDRGES